MQKVNLIVVGGFKEKYFKDAEAEYLKRLTSFSQVKIYECKEHSEKEGEEKLKLEEKEITTALLKCKGKVILLDIKGQLVTSEELAEVISGKTSESVTFIIGGSNGVSENVRSIASDKISFGRVTLPHQLCRVVLLEQIYRAFTIIEGRSYHK